MKTLPVGFQPAGVGDFDGDGHPDVLLYNPNNHQITIAFMNGSTFVKYQYLKTIPVGYHPAAVGDYNSDGRPDVILQDLTNRVVVAGYLIGSGAGLSLTPYQQLVTLPPGLQVVGP